MLEVRSDLDWWGSVKARKDGDAVVVELTLVDSLVRSMDAKDYLNVGSVVHEAARKALQEASS